MKGERIGKTRWYKLLCDRCGEVIGKYRPDLVVVGAAKCDECTKPCKACGRTG